MKYYQWLCEWLQTCVKPTVKVRTYNKYRWTIDKKIVPRLGGYELCELSVSVLQTYIAELSSRYAANTVKGVVALVKGSLVRAQKTGLTERQFSDSIQSPKPKEKQVECFGGREQKKIERYIADTKKPKLYGIIICLYTGLRIGELLSLEWQDIDFKKCTVSVTKSCRDGWERGDYCKLVDTPKTETSVRTIPFPRQLLSYLKEMKKQSESTYVVSGKGKEISVRSYQRTFELLLKKLNIPHRGFHALRHTFATRALECGMDVKTLSEILGHKNPTITLKRYVHSLMDHKTAMMNRVGKLLLSDG